MKAIAPIRASVMAPLLVGDPLDMDSSASRNAWKQFDKHLRRMKRRGVYAVSTDLWWGLLEPSPGKFCWSFSDKLLKHIRRAGLKWVAIFSTHQCGGNVGDDVHVPLQNWVWDWLVKEASAHPLYSWLKNPTPRDFKYVSEQGNESSEVISCHATQLAMPLFRRLFTAFRDHYAEDAEDIAELNISLGPAGEQRYPSYNSHDVNTDYPTRGALQCYSRLAVHSFAQFALEKYGSKEKLDAAWGTRTVAGQVIQPPSNPWQFFQRGDHRNTQYGRDLFDWYAGSLHEHGETLIKLAMDVFGAEDSPMRGIDIGVKVPGIHWRTGETKDGEIHIGDRLAELNAGLIRTSTADSWYSDELGRGYRELISRLARLHDTYVDSNRLVLHFTCLEMSDGEGRERGANSLAASLVRWVGSEAERYCLPLKGENAVSWTLPQEVAWRNIRSHIRHLGVDGKYEGITILRQSDILSSSTALSQFESLMQEIEVFNASLETGSESNLVA